MTGTWREPYETERLRLRPLAMSDGDALHPLQRDGEMMRYFGGPYRREQTDTWLEWHVAMWEQEGYSHWAAELKEEGIFVGWIGLTKVWEPDEILPAVEVGWFVDRRYWGRRLGHRRRPTLTGLWVRGSGSRSSHCQVRPQQLRVGQSHGKDRDAPPP